MVSETVIGPSPNFSASPKPHPSKPHPCNMPQAKTEVALQFSECCAAETALQHWLFCNAEVIWTKSCAAANEKLHCNIEKAALQESGAFLPPSCGFQAPRLGTQVQDRLNFRNFKILASVKCFADTFSGRNWLRQFYGRLAKMRSFCRKKKPWPIKFLV